MNYFDKVRKDLEDKHNLRQSRQKAAEVTPKSKPGKSEKTKSNNKEHEKENKND